MKLKFANALSLALIMAMLFTSIGLADNIQDDLTAGGNDTFTLGGSTTINYWIAANSGDGQSGCNVTDGSPATVTINVPAGVTVTPSSLTFSQCKVGNDNNSQAVVFTASAAGNYSITASVSDSGVGGYNTSPAAFTLHVLAPSDSTPPVITPNVSGTLGNNGWYTSNVTVSWTVTDPESTISSSSGCGTSNVTVDTSGATFTCSASSAGGTNSQSVTIKRDATAPSISGSAAPAPNGAGWNKTDVVVTFSCADTTSGMASCTAPQTLSGNGAAQSASGTAVDAAGNSASTTVSNINIDKELPTINASVPAANGNGWYNGPVNATFNCTDGYSGIASCEGPHTFSAEGSSSFTGHATDVADNANSIDVSVNLDSIAPVIALVSRTPANSNGWNNGNVTLEWSCTDAGSGVVAATITKTVSTEGAGQSESATCEDLAGNTDSDAQTNINIDKTAPTITAQRDTAANANGWNNTDVASSYTASDALSGLDASSPATGSFTFTVEGAGQSHTFTVSDLAGNSASATVSGINIDKTAPSISAQRDTAANANGWNNTDVASSYTASDALSGLDASSPATGSFTFTVEGAGQSHTFTVTDNAGNSNSAIVSGVNIDKTAPIVAVTGVANGATYTLGSVPTADCSTTDGLSGVATNASLSLSGGPVGNFTVTCSGASDKAGNTSAAVSATYSVIYAWNGFFQPIDNLPALNKAKAGSAIPVKFSLSGNQGLAIFAAGYPSSKVIACGDTANADLIETTVTAGGSSLSYDALADQYIYVWKTDKLWAGTCRTLTVKLIDGTVHQANFTFTK